MCVHVCMHVCSHHTTDSTHIEHWDYIKVRTPFRPSLFHGTEQTVPLGWQTCQPENYISSETDIFCSEINTLGSEISISTI